MSAQDGARGRVVDFDDLDPDLEEPGRRARVVSFDDLGGGGAEDAGRRAVSFDGVDSGTVDGGAESRPASFDDAGAGRGSGSRPPRSGRSGDRRIGERRDVEADDVGTSGVGRPGTAASPDGTRNGDVSTGPRPTEDPAATRADADAERRGRRGGRGGARGGRGGRAPAADGPRDDEARAKEICLRLLTDRARTVKELADALRRKEVPDDVATRVLERFDDVGLVDDEAFAGQWVRSRHRHKGLGRRAIAAELHRKGVAKEIADTALTEIDAESEEARARELVDRRLRSMPVHTKEDRAGAARRLVGMLARKGYGSGVAYSVVREAIAARGADEDELGEGPVDA